MPAMLAADRRGRTVEVTVPIWLTAAVIVGGVGAALLIWSLVDPSTRPMSSLGLSSTLDWRYPAGLFLLLVAFVIEVSGPGTREWVLGLISVAMIFGLFGLAPAVEGTARLPTAWLHSGFASYIAQHGATLKDYDARFDWPGFFGAVALLTKSAGMPNAQALLAWAPVAFMLGYVLALRVVAMRLGLAVRATWLGLLVFVIAQWTEEEYFSPQATAYLIALVLLALAIKSPRDNELTKPARIGAIVIWLVMAMAVVASHQLTPFAATIWLVALLICRQARWPTLVPVLPLAGIAWLAYAAQDFWRGHKSVLFGGVGSVKSSVSTSLGSRLGGDATHQFVVDLRVGLTVLTIALAIAGAAVHRRRGGTWTLVIAGFVPFGLIAVQSYGGEILIRSFLFGLPFLAMLAGVGIEWLLALKLDGRQFTADAIGRLGSFVATMARPATLALLVIVAGALVIARGGNDPFVAVTAADVHVVGEATAGLPAGTSLDEMNGYLPIRFSRVGQVGAISLQNDCNNPAKDTSCVLHIEPEALVLTRGESNYAEIVEGWPAGWQPKLIKALVASGHYRVWFSDGDATALKRTHP